ncbi:MAG TPA: creatininase family protein [Rhodospirillales bacterium]|jgi:creatinine amidohydrolase
MRLQLCTWPEVETYLKKSTGVIVPIGSTEQHGPTGFVGTDAICPELLAAGVGDKLGALVAPTISIGMAQHHLGFPGSVTLRPTTLIAVVKDVIQSLVRHGFDRFFFVNGHGGNIPTLNAAFSEVYAERSLGAAGGNQPSVRCQLRNWWIMPSVLKIAEKEFGEAEGRHATPSEVSLTYYGYPKDAKRVARKRLTPKRAPDGPIYDADDYRRRFPDGRIASDPGMATVAIGKRLYHAAVAELAGDYQEFMKAK